MYVVSSTQLQNVYTVPVPRGVSPSVFGNDQKLRLGHNTPNLMNVILHMLKESVL